VVIDMTLTPVIFFLMMSVVIACMSSVLSGTGVFAVSVGVMMMVSVTALSMVLVIFFAMRS